MYGKAIAAIVVATFALAAGLAGAQEATHTVTIVTVAPADYPHGGIVVNVEDESGGLGELTAEDFTVTLDGAPVPILSAELASSSDEPIDVVMVIDTSGSMEGGPIAAAKDAAKVFIEGLSPDDRVAILSYANDVQLQLDYTTDRAAAFETIDGLAAWGNTALFQATAASAYKAVGSTAARRAIILLSDGASDVLGAGSRDDALASARTVGVPFFVIAQGDEPDRAYLTELVAATNGRLLDAARPEDVNGVFNDIGRLLSDQYIVTFDGSSVAALQEVEVRLEARVDGGVAADTGTFRPDRSLRSVMGISGIENGDEVDGVRQVLVTFAHGNENATVSFFIDDALAFASTAQPHVFEYDPAAYGRGEHTLRVAVTSGDDSHEVSIPFTSQPAPAASSGGGLPVVPIAIAAFALVVLGGGGFVFMRLRANRAPDGVPVDQRVIPWAAQVAAAKQVAPTMPLLHADDEEVEPEDVGEPLGVLISRAGSDLGAEYVVGGKPVSVGSGTRCGVRVDDTTLASEEARVWVRNGHLMLHKMTRLTAVSMDGTVGGWVILEPGDTFDVGEHRFEFRMLEESQPVADAMVEAGNDRDAEPGVPNILRDPEPGRRDVPRLTDMMPPQIGGTS